MAMVKAMLPLFLALVSLCLINIANGGHSFVEEKKMFNVQMLQQRKQQLGGTLGCLLPESSEFSMKNKKGSS